MSVVSQDITKDRFRFVPDLGTYSSPVTDEELCKKWDITNDEYNYIQSRIGEAGGEE